MFFGICELSCWDDHGRDELMSLKQSDRDEKFGREFLQKLSVRLGPLVLSFRSKLESYARYSRQLLWEDILRANMLLGKTSPHILPGFFVHIEAQARKSLTQRRSRKHIHTRGSKSVLWHTSLGTQPSWHWIFYWSVSRLIGSHDSFWLGLRSWQCYWRLRSIGSQDSRFLEVRLVKQLRPFRFESSRSEFSTECS